MSNSDFTIMYDVLRIDGINVAFREAGRDNHPKLVLLHGFPASSHQYRNLIPVLADQFHVIAPDYPGFGNSDMPDPAKYSYTFDTLSEVVEKFLRQKDSIASAYSLRTTVGRLVSESWRAIRIGLSG